MHIMEPFEKLIRSVHTIGFKYITKDENGKIKIFEEEPRIYNISPKRYWWSEFQYVEIKCDCFPDHLNLEHSKIDVEEFVNNSSYREPKSCNCINPRSYPDKNICVYCEDIIDE